MTDQGKPISASRVTISQMMGPQDTNGYGNVHGGVIMKLADEAGALASMRHAQAPTVTVSVDSMTFMEPIYVGNFVQFNAELTYVGRTSMEVRVEVVKENPVTGERRISNTAYIVYVALDGDGHPKSVPPLAYETDEEKRRAQLAEERQAFRKQQRSQEKQLK
ncbi:acyl-CoA thioesterase [Phototrophicus methaneseepsis]|uniref:Acyl-CoA thioesterase n=1 Tax=Phototrophicus methaneseepsis TaxID=2710758 RepID=A0A7S8E6B0_9CHLR|nr:acyl-CoA thioesterase [Phototrophicus methaneseepsis]QPC81189.1 acyl-CoA thioesterase [Phototrophicus methaneseepsis]